MRSRALVLGGGGPVGIAWESGLIAGLAESGIDLSGADFIVGTSAGSVVGAQIALGRKPAALAEPFTEKGEPTPPPSESMSKPPDLSQLVAKLMESYAGVRPNEEVCREIGAWALETSGVSEEAFVAGIGSSLAGLPGERWPARRFACTAVDAVSGKSVTWANDSGVPLVRAIASSCAVPGIASRSQSTAGDTWMEACGRRRMPIWRRGTTWWLSFRSAVRPFRNRSAVRWSENSWLCTIAAAELRLSRRMRRA